MLVGDDFKKDTCARGVLAVKIRSASGFKEGDQSLGGLKKGSSKRLNPPLCYSAAVVLGEGLTQCLDVSIKELKLSWDHIGELIGCVTRRRLRCRRMVEVR